MVEKITKLECLNGLRGFAVLLVLLSHASNVDVFLLERVSFSGGGHYGVFLFFVLSSFLLTRQFLVLDKRGEFSKAALWTYFSRRFLRIYPLYTVTLVAYYLLFKIDLLIVPVSGDMILKSLLLLDAEGIFWTVPVEFQFYFILPLISYLLVIQANTVYTMIAGGVFCGVWTFFFSPEYTVNVVPFMPVFVIGSLAAKFYVSMSNFKIRNETFRFDTGCKCYNFLSCIVMLSFVFLIPNIYRSIAPSNIGLIDFQGQFILWGILSAILILSTISSNGIVHQLMESRFFVFWGKVSFSAYLGHKIILAFVNELSFMPPSVKFLLFFSLTAFFSNISYRYLERPLGKINITRKILCTS